MELLSVRRSLQRYVSLQMFQSALKKQYIFEEYEVVKRGVYRLAASGVHHL